MNGERAVQALCVGFVVGYAIFAGIGIWYDYLDKRKRQGERDGTV